MGMQLTIESINYETNGLVMFCVFSIEKGMVIKMGKVFYKKIYSIKEAYVALYKV